MCSYFSQDYQLVSDSRWRVTYFVLALCLGIFLIPPGTLSVLYVGVPLLQQFWLRAY